jgi:hypothetical protein
VHSVQSGFEAAPHEPKISDDKAAMYNSINRAALFAALHERPEFRNYIPLYRVLYGRPARIFLARGDGEFTVPRVWPRDIEEDDLIGEGERVAGVDGDATDDARFVNLTGDSTRDNQEILAAVRSGCGVVQGCLIATFGACFPMHTCLHRVQKEFPTVGIVVVADDAYYTGPVDVIYKQGLRSDP